MVSRHPSYASYLCLNLGTPFSVLLLRQDLEDDDDEEVIDIMDYNVDEGGAAGTSNGKGKQRASSHVMDVIIVHDSDDEDYEGKGKAPANRHVFDVKKLENESMWWWGALIGTYLITREKLRKEGKIIDDKFPLTSEQARHTRPDALESYQVEVGNHKWAKLKQLALFYALRSKTGGKDIQVYAPLLNREVHQFTLICVLIG